MYSARIRRSERALSRASKTPSALRYVSRFAEEERADGLGSAGGFQETAWRDLPQRGVYDGRPPRIGVPLTDGEGREGTGMDDLGHVVDKLPELISTTFPEGRVDFVGRRWCEYTGLGVDEATGTGWHTAIHPEDLPKLLERLGSVPARDECLELEMRLPCRDGAEATFSFSIPAEPMATLAGDNGPIEQAKTALESLDV